MHVTQSLLLPAMRTPLSRRAPTPAFGHPSEEGMGTVPLLGGVALSLSKGRGGFLFASYIKEERHEHED